MGNSSNDFFKTQVLGHPAGLFVLFFTEMWERFCNIIKSCMKETDVWCKIVVFWYNNCLFWASQFENNNL